MKKKIMPNYPIYASNSFDKRPLTAAHKHPCAHPHETNGNLYHAISFEHITQKYTEQIKSGRKLCASDGAKAWKRDSGTGQKDKHGPNLLIKWTYSTREIEKSQSLQCASIAPSAWQLADAAESDEDRCVKFIDAIRALSIFIRQLCVCVCASSVFFVRRCCCAALIFFFMAKSPSLFAFCASFATYIHARTRCLQIQTKRKHTSRPSSCCCSCAMAIRFASVRRCAVFVFCFDFF